MLPPPLQRRQVLHEHDGDVFLPEQRLLRRFPTAVHLLRAELGLARGLGWARRRRMRSRTPPQLPEGEVVFAARPPEEAVETPALRPVQVLRRHRQRRGAALRVGGEDGADGRGGRGCAPAGLRRGGDHAPWVLEHLPNGERAGEQLR